MVDFIGRQKISYFLLLGLYCIVNTSVVAQDVVTRQEEFNLVNDNVAVHGYDVVSYFMGSPQKGKKSISYSNDGVNYWFNNADNLELFKKQPKKFEPVYGGWCAYAMGKTGEKVKIDPKTYKIIDGKLYLFYNFYSNNTLIDWNKDESKLKAKADDYWQEIINKP
jgi:YHS domain-containing protein